MLYESAHLRITVEFGIATVWLGFPGAPVNALDAAGFRELEAAFAALERHPHVRIVVVRSAKPAGFCTGVAPRALDSLSTPADRAAFSWLGQEVLARLAALRAVTIASIEGPCLGAGLELALACDYRLCVSSSRTHLGFPNRIAAFGGSVRLRNRMGTRNARRFIASGRTISGREARALGIVDRAFCERRAKIELHSFLDEIERGEWVPRRRAVLGGFAAERRRFAMACPAIARPLPAELPISVALARGFITPFEAEQLRKREAAIAIPAASELVPKFEFVAARLPYMHAPQSLQQTSARP